MKLLHSMRIAGMLAASVLFADNAPVYVGVLEQPVMQPDSSVHPEGPHVRIVFRFMNAHWTAMPHEAVDLDHLAALQKLYPGRVFWTVTLDGKKLGAIESRQAVAAQPGSLLYKNIGLQELTPESKVPTVSEGASAFVTWMGASRYRPLVLVSPANYADPDVWKPFLPTAALAVQAHAAFRKALNRPRNSYSDKAIHLQPRGYRSSRGDSLIALTLDPSLHEAETSENAAPAWFLVQGRTAHWIGNGLTLIDAGDYDGDGTSELLFQKSGYNSDGYLLFHVRDKSKEEFEWSYH